VLKEHYAIPHDGFGGILEKIKEKFNLVGISGKLKSWIEYIQWKRLESMLMAEPPEIRSKLYPYIQQQLQNMK
jgi:hypothetical protein